MCLVFLSNTFCMIPLVTYVAPMVFSPATKVIGILTLIESAIGIYTFFQISQVGLWVSLQTYEEVSFFLVHVAYLSIIMPIAALVIGLSAMKNKQWSWRPNIILQIATIAVFLYILLPLYLEVPQAIFLFNFSLLYLILASLILYLLLRRNWNVMIRALTGRNFGLWAVDWIEPNLLLFTWISSDFVCGSRCQLRE